MFLWTGDSARNEVEWQTGTKDSLRSSCKQCSSQLYFILSTVVSQCVVLVSDVQQRDLEVPDIYPLTGRN